MLVQSIDNKHVVPAFRTLHFSKTPTILLNGAEDIFEHEEVSITKNGIRYLEDKDIPKQIKERLANIPFIKELSRKCETFIWFVESKGPKDYRSWVKISHVENGSNNVTNHYVVVKNEYGQDVATETMFRNLREKKFTVL